MKEETHKLQADVEAIKAAILQCQRRAITHVGREQLALYYGIGRHISQHSREQKWGSGAIAAISERLHKELPGIRGFSERNIKNMRTFYEEWSMLDDNPAVATAEIETSDMEAEVRQSRLPGHAAFPADAFLSISFTHHITILSQAKAMDERCFYLRMCRDECLSVSALRRAIQQDTFHHKGALPNNFLATLPTGEQARRAIMAFKDEYLLDFINVEELGARDIEDVDERVVENAIVRNIKNFIMTFGRDFTFVGNQYRVEALGHTHIIDLLFYNRALEALVAVELKTGPFKTAYLGQLSMYLKVLDDYVRKPNEKPSIGIILCKSADKAYVEYAVRDYSNPMGVATYRTGADMPAPLKNALPDIEELKRLL